ncbi:MAG: ABC transporter permease [Gemmataceae bacterium]|nr:ABC transporter permease [Gemmataceae bacterium]
MLGPIFAREFVTVPRSDRHYTGRAAALGGLWTLGITAWLTASALGPSMTLGESARFGRLLFQIYAFVALVLVVFFSSLTAAGAVAREKDRRTFLLLLLSDLRDSEIVLGKMLGSLLPIGLLLLGILPVLSVLVLLGGIRPEQVLQAWLVLLTSGIVSGSLGACVALWRDKAYQSLAFSVLGVVLYLCLVRVVSSVGAVVWPHLPWTTILAWSDPVTALLAAVEQTPESVEQFPAAIGYAFVMVAFSVTLNLIGIWRLRVWNPGREAIQQRESKQDYELDEKARERAHAAPGRPREVWPNPVLWREIRTRAYGRRTILVKLLYAVVIGLIAYASLASIRADRVPFEAAYGLLPVAFLSFLLVAAQAVTSVTAERDLGALDLLLVTDLSPREFIFGKMAGVLWNVKEFLIPPIALAGAYAWFGRLASAPLGAADRASGMNAESFLATSLGLALLQVFVLVFGVFIALRVAHSRQAILQTLGTVFFLSIGTCICIYLILINGGTFEYQFLSFALFLIAGIGGLLWVLGGDLPSAALTLASVALPLGVFYAVTNVLVAKPGSVESTPPLVPFLVVTGSFGFAIAAMLVPLLSEFDVALGRTRAAE